MTLKVMTYNILNGGEGREPLILDVIQSIQPDLLVLQEVYTPDFLQYLANELQMKPFFASGNQKRRVALLSSLPVRNFHSIHPRPIWRNMITAEIDIGTNQSLHLFGVHPKASLGILSEVWRWLEARYILALVESFADRPCLIAGDFNAIAPGDTFDMATMPWWLKLELWLQGRRTYHFSIQRYLDAGFIDCFRYLEQNATGYTLPPPSPNSRLDYIFINNLLKSSLKGCWIVRESLSVDEASDHYPVVAEFSV